ncbi:uncharacterized protein LOC123294083 isoform X3 [Chrysoperla carnea]|uniref:uncharacterized protein LOC123294083 isoform X3 n=1 Tax=Chrysoperla carnea TaxID=189513 RepID=UPI001D06CA4D|nr:uncharacterized protein LOC123294083 isoform X3 [Chrysoperla carnea]
MSWIKKRATPSPVSNTTAGVPGVPLYNTNQPAQYQQQWQQNYKNPQTFQQPQSLPPQYPPNNWYNQTQGQTVPTNNQEQNYNWNQTSQQNIGGGSGNYWQTTDQQQSAYNNVIAPGTNANQYPYQTPTPPLLLQSQNQQYYQNAGYHQNVGQTQPPRPSSVQQSQHDFNQSNYTQQQQQQPTSLTNQNNPESDPWDWGWGDESTTNNSGNTNENNVNQNFSTIQDSFNQGDDTWNWTVEDSNSSSTSNSYKTEIGKQQMKNETKLDEQSPSVLFEQMGPLAGKHQGKPTEEPKENVVSLEQIPSTFTGRRMQQNDSTLTPQWSIESQLSQDSSDDMLPTSESNKLSRSSTISQCPSLPNSSQDCEQTYTNQEEIKQEPPSMSPWTDSNFEPTQISDVTQAINNLTLQHQNLFENKEIVTPETHIAKNVTPPLNPVKISSPPLTTPPPGPSNVEDSVNPYKRSSGKPNYKIRVASNLYTGRSSQENILSSNFIQQPNLLEKKSQLEVNQVANLETVPDNVERPDQIPIDLTCQNNTSRKINNQPWSSSSGVENLEVAPKNDRNQYLETGQLSDNDVPDIQQNDSEQNTEEPPPGLRRMVLGRTENESIASSSINPTPRILTGLDRVVDGESENVMNSQSINSNSIPEGNYELPAGLHRMVPGESSSPESNARWLTNATNAYFRSNTFDDDDTEAELQNIEGNIPHRPAQRSETIGADTPPTTQSSDSALNRNRNVLASDVRETNVDGADTQSDSVPVSSDTSVRNGSQNHDRIDVQTTLRSQTDGENTTDNNTAKDQNRLTTRTDSSEDDREIREASVDRRKNKSPTPRYEKDKKYYRERESSPERYWDRKNDRRRRGGGTGIGDRDTRFYEEDTDYSSDKERKDRRLKDNRPNRDEYDRIYNSLKRVIEREGGRGPEYDRMISTLRREMDRDGVDRDREHRVERSKRDRGRERGSEYDGREQRRDDFYYDRRYEDDYYGRESRSSRPSSRSDSNYRERLDHRKTRDPYNSYYQGAYDPYYAAHYQQHYQYYENLRRTNPAAYAEWYRKYLQSYGAMGAGPTSIEGFRGHEDKASVHSGRSSANDELHKERCTSHRYYSGGSSEVSHMGGYFSQSHTHSYSQEYSRPLDRTESSLNLEDSSVSVQRLTPTKFSTAHVKASISSGHLVRVLPHYPMDGQSPLVEIMELHELLLANDPEQQELADFPGPLIKGVTHKKTLIEYCENKIKKAESFTSNQHINDKESYILMWELLILLLRQNGVVVGTDIAELLMRNASRQNSNASTNSRRESIVSSVSSLPEEIPSVAVPDTDDNPPTSSTFKQTNGTNSKGNAFNETYLTNKFREYLIYGSGKEALEWAMKHGLWGHALFLASKLDKRTYANVMMRFANGLTINDPLQTLYQLLSGRQPAAVTCVLDEKWGDWRPHLAMILSNTSQRPELDRKAITTLGDTLQARGSLYAAHFCYLMAQTGFGRFNYKAGRLVLLGSSHQKEFREFATNEAIIMTEIYEYACSLSDTTFTIPEFQPYKYLIATRLAERGFFERALLYTERIGTIISQNPTRYDAVFANQILVLAERLCARDPTAMAEFQLDANESTDDNFINSSWISSLKSVLNDYNMGILQERQSMSNLASSELDITQSLTPPTDHHDDVAAVQQQHQQLQQQQQHTQQQQQHNIDQTQQFYQTDNFLPQQNQPDNNTLSSTTWSDNQYQSQQQQQQQQQSDINNKQQQQTISYHTTQQDDRRFGNEYQQNQYWDQQQWSTDRNITEHDSNQQHQQLQDNNYLDNIQDQYQQQTSSPMQQQPQITMPNSLGNSRQYDYDQDNNQRKSNAENKPAKSSSSALSNKQGNSSSSGWFGGIWNKLSLRPKNQMILPDDKNPTIVWDPEKKKWVNLDADGEEANNEVKPPPKMTDLLHNKPGGGMPPPSLNSYQQSNNNQQQLQMQQMQQAQVLHNNAINNNQKLQQQQPLPPVGVDENDTQFKPPSAPNMFKMQRGRGIKKAYVDVFNPGGTAKSTNPTSALPSLNPSTIPPSNNFFIPAPVNDPNAPIDFLSPSSGVELHSNAEHHDKT